MDEEENTFIDFGQYPPEVPLETSSIVHCGHCGEEFVGILELYIHYQGEHWAEQVFGFCVTCKRLFNLADLIEHFEHAYRCAVCCSISIDVSHWCRHNWTHSHMRRYKCTLCNEGNNRLSYLMQHINQMHPPTDQ
jgi:hypothetical protein